MKTTIGPNKPIEEISSFQNHYIFNNDEKWVEPAYNLPVFTPSVEIIPLEKELVTPELISGYYTIKYNDILHTDEILLVGPGLKAKLYSKPLFNEKICSFGTDNPSGTVFDKGYVVYRTPRATVRPGKKYLFKLTGKSENGASSLAVIKFTCGKEKKDVAAFENKFTSEFKTYETELTTPEFTGKSQIFMEMYFYRAKQKGTVIYKNFSFTSQEKPQDVSSRLQGRLRPLEKFFTIWQFKDNSNNDYLARPKAIVRFFNPDESNTASDIGNLPFF